MNTTKILKSASKDEKQIDAGQTIFAPVRMHELLGLTKSTEKQGLQPVRLKHLMMSSESKKPTKIVRDTTDCCPVSAQKRFEPVKLGLLMSEGKLNKTNDLGRERLKPEKMKDIMKSWEKSQTVQPRARPQTVIQPRTAGVRRKLYSTYHPSSPAKPQKMGIAETKTVQDRKSIAPFNRKSHRPDASRKSYLPQYSMRDKSTNLDKIERTRETSKVIQTTTGDTEKVNPTEQSDKDRELLNGVCESEILDEAKGILKQSAKKMVNFSSPEKPLIDDEKREKRKNCGNDEQRKIDSSAKNPRPTVIMGISTNGTIPKESLKFLDDENSQRNDRDESFYYENLPRKSFIESTESERNEFVNMDRKSILWMHGNVKVAIQSAEEQLFSMRRVLRALEDILQNTDKSRAEIIPTEIVSDDISSSERLQIVETTDVEEPNTNDPPIHDNPLILNEKLETSKIVIEDPSDLDRTLNTDEDDKENVCTNNDENKENNVNKPRRRSLRLASQTTGSSKSSNDSFLNFEKELNIINVKTKKNDPPASVKTEKRFDPRARRSVREYMALKSSMNFLQTPDHRGLPTPNREKDTPSHRLSTRRSLSRKLLSELDDLYDDSPM